VSLKSDYFIKKIDYQTAMSVVTVQHYLKRRCPAKFCFGMYDKSNENLVGVITYGIPPSHTLLKGVCGESEKGNVIELNRLWVSDDCPKNSESFLIGNTIKKIPYEIIVSFSEIQQGHIGYVYQATNFLYCGLSAKFKDPIVKGYEGMHHATYAKGMSNQQVIEHYGKDNVEFRERPRKHRYVYLNCTTKRKKQLLSKLLYKTLPYPKAVTI
jgi:hypothetical protein